ncbi:MAG TPA: imidazolonepropionase, partial [Thermoplasmata archaeon]|nr:imidazolonepropionase [Thermoplasmata archaeon]
MTDVDLVIRASRMVTPEGPAPLTGDAMRRLGIVDDPVIAVEDGVIVDLGPAERLEGGYRGAVRLDLPGRTLVPGFVDPHTHALFVGSRADEVVMRLEGMSYMDVLKAGGGILRTMRAVREASDSDLIMATLNRLDRMLAHGTTTAEVKTGYALSPEGEVPLLEVLRGIEHPVTVVPTFLGAHAVPPEFDSASDYVDALIGVLPRAAELAGSCDVFCEEKVFGICEIRRLL